MMLTPKQRLQPIRLADPALRALREGALVSSGQRWTPSGVEEISFLLARAAVTHGTAMAIGVPRGRHHLAPAISAYLAFARTNALLPFVGNVALATGDLGARLRLDRLRSGGDRFAPPAVRRLMAGPVRVDGRPTTQVRSLSGTEGAKGVSGDDRLLLVHRPAFQPSVPKNVISVSVVDCVTCSDRTWPALRAWSEDAERAQVFVGELGDTAFEDFCQAHVIPIWRFDWATLAAEGVEGAGALALDALIRRSREAVPALRFRICDDSVVDGHLRELDERFGQMLRKAKGEPPPRPVLAARRLSWFLARVAVPLDVYATAAVREYGALQPHRELGYVTGAYKGQFTGAWAALWESDWAVVAGEVRRLYEYVDRESPKYLDLHAMVEHYRSKRTMLTIRCSTRAEARALGPALVDNAAVTLEELTAEHPPVEIVWFGRQTPPLPHGPTTSKRLTIVTEVPPPYRASLYCSAEEGVIEALLYPAQARWLRLNARRAAERCAGGARNAAVIAGAYHGDVAPDMTVVDLPIVKLDSIGFGGRKPVEDAPPPDDAVKHMMAFFSEIAAMNDGDLPDDLTRPSQAPAAHDACATVDAVLVRTRQHTSVALPAGTKVDQLVAGKLRSVPVDDLADGARVVLVDGNQRGTVVHDLMESWDERFGPARVFYDLYLQAFQAAYVNAGDADAALAQVVGVQPGTVRLWRIGENLAPQQDAPLKAILEQSGNRDAVSNFAQIRHYLRTVRGMHRLIGRILNEAVSETLVADDGPAQRELQELTGLDLTDFFASLQVFTVCGVIPAGPVPAARLGRFLAADDPIVTTATA
jgi:hypothetical protein